MLRIIVLVIFGILSLLSIACKQSTDPPPETPINDEFTFNSSDYIHFPTGKFIIMKYTNQYENTWGEMVINWEKSFGEPFTDINGNGIYDPGIDGFKISGDPAINQDINYNSRYDSPEAKWEVGIPFDDINGDGICQQTIDYIYLYEDGLPFGDWNRNGINDDESYFHYDIVICSLMAFPSGTKTYDFYFRMDSVFSFTSDSGKTYILPPYSDPFPYSRPIVRNLHFVLYDGSLQFWDEYPFYTNYTRQITIIDTGLVKAESNQLVAATIFGLNANNTFRKSIILDTQLIIENNMYDNLLLIRFDSARYDLPDNPNFLTKEKYEFYFSKSSGLLTIKYHQRYGDTCTEYNFDTYADTLPIPATR